MPHTKADTIYNDMIPEEYSYTVAWSPEDDAFISRVTEFPLLAAHGGTQEKALREARTVVEYVLEDLAASFERFLPSLPLPKKAAN